MTRVKTDYASTHFKHRVHRSKKNRKNVNKHQKERTIDFKKRKLAILIKELDEDTHNR